MPEWMSIPDLPDDQIEKRLHLERYEYAASVLKGKQVIDAACGMGYGTEIMRAAGVIPLGIDKDGDAVEIARSRYAGMYIRGDLETAAFHAWSPLDALVSFETLEHLTRPRAVLLALPPWTHEIVCSVPIRPTKHNNHWHRHDFTKDSFRALITEFFPEVIKSWVQIFSDGEEMYMVIHAKR